MKPKNYLLCSAMLLFSCAKMWGQCNPAPLVILTGGVCPGSQLEATFNIAGTLQWQRDGTTVATQTVAPNGDAQIVAGGGWGLSLSALNYPNRFVRDAAGNLYIPDMYNHRVMKWAPGANAGVVYAGKEGWVVDAEHLDSPTSVALDSKGNLFICDQGNNRVMKWAPGSSFGEVVLGSLATPTGVFVDAQDNLYISEQRASKVIRLAPGSTTAVVVAGGNGSGTSASQLSTPTGIFVDAAGNLYVCDTDNNRVMKWAPGASSGVTVAGGNGLGSGLNQLANPLALYGDGAGNLYISDFTNRRIVKWQQGQPAGSVILEHHQGSRIRPTGIVVDASGTLYFADGDRGLVIKVTPPGMAATHIAMVPGSYTATVTNASGCTATSNPITVMPSREPQITITTENETLCPGAEATFTASITDGGTSPVFTWMKNGIVTGGNTHQFITSNLAHGDVLRCVLQSSEQCLTTATDTSNIIAISLHPKAVPISLGADRRVCPGSSVTFDAGATVTPMVWQDGTTGTRFTTNNPGTFSVKTTDACGGSFADTVNITHFLPPADFLAPTATVCSNGAVELKGRAGFVQYQWSTGAATDAIEIRNPGSYRLQVMDKNQCSWQDSVIVTQIECGARIYFPTSFSPNGDGRNDLFRPVLYSAVKNYRFTVFNRWGNIVFQTTEPGKGWSGKTNGAVQSGSVFVWTCSYQFLGEPVQEEKGTVVLLQ